MADQKRTVPWWVKVLVIFHCFMVLSWSIPDPAQAVKIGVAKPKGLEVLLSANYSLKQSPLHNYITWTGLWQSWDMFSPNPSSTDIWCDAEVEYESGDVMPFVYPRIYDLSIPAKYVNERYRKLFERVNQDKYSFIWPYFAQRIAQLSYFDPNNPPITVRLTRHWKQIPPIGKPIPKDYDWYTFFTYSVDQVKLRETK